MKNILVIVVCLTSLISNAQVNTHKSDSRTTEYNVEYQKVFYHLLDSFRRVNGKPSFQVDSVLEESALQHSKYQDYEGKLTHVEDNWRNPYLVGKEVWNRNGISENIMFSMDYLPVRFNATIDFKVWIESPGHRENMLSNYTVVGVAIYGEYATTVFGKIHYN
jgi:uncharacterized protein YkwD